MAKFYHAVLILLGLSSLAIFIGQFKDPYLYLAMLPGVILLFHLRKVMQTTKAEKFDPELKVVALTTFLLSLALWGAFIYMKSA